MRPTFTVFTATYNRARTLHRVWESLCAQTFRSFEWIVVDDNSADNTAELVESWRAQADFPVRFYRQRKPGKHMASNLAAELAGGELFLPLDSDDGCVPSALERFIFHWRAIPEGERAGFSAVTALAADQHGRPAGGKFPKDILDSDSLEMKYRWRVKGEKWGFQRTDVMRRFPFPDQPHRALPEGIVWSGIARHYKTRYINEVLRIYWIEPRSGAMTGGGFASACAAGYGYWHQNVLNTELDWFRFAPLDFLAAAAHYARFSFHGGLNLSWQWRGLRPAARALWLAAFPLGFLAFLSDKMRDK
ncbi:MAG: glycosyltransferase family A protein [Elusimicrobiales bacterium]